MSRDSDDIKNKEHLDDEVSCGELLAKTRLAKDLSTKDIAKELRISAAVIEMIERDDFEKIGASVFVKGYLRQYADILGLPVDQLLESYNQLNPEKSSAPIVLEFKLSSHIQIKSVLIDCAAIFCLRLRPSEFCFLIFR